MRLEKNVIRVKEKDRVIYVGNVTEEEQRNAVMALIKGAQCSLIFSR